MRLTVFAKLLALSTIFASAYEYNRHGFRLSADFPVMIAHPLDLALLASALFVLLRPFSGGTFLLYALSQFLHVLYFLPIATNMHFFLFLASIAMLWASGILLWKERQVAPDKLEHLLSPVLRLEFVILWIFVALAKYNTDFLNPQLSCATSGPLWSVLQSQFPFLHAPNDVSARLVLIYSVVAVETAIPISLMIPQTRMLGIVMGLSFQLLLGMTGHWDFSAMSLAFYSLFVPSSIWKEIKIPSPALRPIAISIASILLAAFILYYPDHAKTVFYCLWLVCYPVATLGAAFLLLRHSSMSEGPIFSRHPLNCAAILVVLNGLNPYLGLKTHHSFAMFSNLRTEKDRANHLFMPVIPLADYQSDLGRVDGDGSVRRLMPWYALKEFLRDQCEKGSSQCEEIRLIRGDQRMHLKSKDEILAVIGSKPGLIQKKFLLFKSVPGDGPNHCSY